MMQRLFAALAAAAALTSGAAVTVLNSPTPLTAPQNTHFPPLQVLVTNDAGQPQTFVPVKFSLPRTLSIETNGECIGEPGFTCTRLTDGAGVATLDRYFARTPGNTFISISALQWPAPDFGSARVEVIATPSVFPLASAAVTVVSGNNQSALIGSRYLEPFVVRATAPGNLPIANTDVTFVVQGGIAGGSFANVFPVGDVATYTARTDANGVAVSAEMVAGWGLGDGHVNVELVSGGEVRTAVIDFRNVNSRGGIDIALQNMWWHGFDENGWGMSVAQHKDHLFSVIYAYDDDGNPTWWVQPDGRWFAGVGSSFRGSLYSPRGSPFHHYDAGQFRPGFGFTELDLRFNGPEFGSIAASFFGLNVMKSIQVQDFNSGNFAPFDSLGDMWWGGVDQNGWGVAIMQQPTGLFAVWFTYNDRSEPTWFVMPTGTWAGNTYSGGLYQTRGSRFSPYDPSRFAITQSGTVAINFIDDQNATFTYSIGGQQGVLTLVRQPF